MSPRLFVFSRALLAVGLMVGFYALALAIISLLGFIGYEAVATGRLGFGGLKILAFCGIGIVTIFFSVLPRREEFKQPGPLVEPSDFPDLFREIRDIAAKAGQAMPAEIYLLPDLNAFVSERGGFLGFGRVRILGVGLPLLQTLTVNEVRAVLAHEFGHYHGGDTAVGPWIHKIRAAMARTLEGLAEQSAILRKPFEWYGILFLRTTLAVSRYQEYAADQLAASVAGRLPMVSGLKKVHAFGPMSSAFWTHEVGPAINAGYRPRLAEGFQAFLATPRISASLPKILEDVLKEESTSPYNSHPCLRDRLLALGGADPAPGEADDASGPALELVRGHERLEPGLFGFMLGISPDKLEPLAWEDSGEKIHRPRMASFYEPFAAKLATLSFREYPDYFDQPGKVAGLLKDVDGLPDDPEDLKACIRELLEVHLVMSLCAQDGTIRSRPGHPLECVPASGTGFVMGDFPKAFAGKTMPTEQWEENCRAWKLFPAGPA